MALCLSVDEELLSAIPEEREINQSHVLRALDCTDTCQGQPGSSMCPWKWQGIACMRLAAGAERGGQHWVFSSQTGWFGFGFSLLPALKGPF